MPVVVSVEQPLVAGADTMGWGQAFLAEGENDARGQSRAGVCSHR